MKRVVSLLVFCLIMTSIVGMSVVYANPEAAQESVVEEPVIVSILNKKEDSPAPVLSIIEVEVGETSEGESQKILAFSEDGQKPLFNVESPEYLAFQKAFLFPYLNACKHRKPYQQKNAPLILELLLSLCQNNKALCKNYVLIDVK